MPTQSALSPLAILSINISNKFNVDLSVTFQTRSRSPLRNASILSKLSRDILHISISHESDVDLVITFVNF